MSHEEGPPPHALLKDIVLQREFDADLQKFANKPLPAGKGMIYIGYCVPSTKMYVGQHAYSARYNTSVMAARWRPHLKDTNGCVALRNAVSKHGRNAFRWIVVEIVSIEDLNDREVYWIEALNTVVPSGYNLKSGGNRPVHAEATIAKMRKTRNDPVYVSALKSRAKQRFSNTETRERLLDAMNAGKKGSKAVSDARKKQWADKSPEEREEWKRKHKDAADLKRRMKLEKCTTQAETDALLKYFAKLDRTNELAQLARDGKHVVTPRGPNTGRSGKRKRA